MLRSFACGYIQIYVHICTLWLGLFPHISFIFASICIPLDNNEVLSLHLTGMPDFLEKLHTAALRAKNLEVGIHDYAGVIKSGDTNRQPSQERLSGDNTHTSGPGQIYAWDGYFVD